MTKKTTDDKNTSVLVQPTAQGSGNEPAPEPEGPVNPRLEAMKRIGERRREEMLPPEPEPEPDPRDEQFAAMETRLAELEKADAEPEPNPEPVDPFPPVEPQAAAESEPPPAEPEPDPMDGFKKEFADAMADADDEGAMAAVEKMDKLKEERWQAQAMARWDYQRQQENATNKFVADHPDIVADQYLMGRANERIVELQNGGKSIGEAAEQAGKEVQGWVDKLRGEQTQAIKPADVKVGDMSDRLQQKRETVFDTPDASQQGGADDANRPATQSEMIARMRRKRMVV